MDYRIRELRDITGLSQRDFAAKYDIPLSTRFVNGSREMQHLRNMCEADSGYPSGILMKIHCTTLNISLRSYSRAEYM